MQDPRTVQAEAAQAEVRAARQLARALVTAEDLVQTQRRIDRARLDDRGISRHEMNALDDRLQRNRRFLGVIDEAGVDAQRGQTAARNLADLARGSIEESPGRQPAPAMIVEELLRGHQRLQAQLGEVEEVWTRVTREMRERERRNRPSKAEERVFEGTHAVSRSLRDAAHALADARALIGRSEELAVQAGRSLANLFGVLDRGQSARAVEAPEFDR